MKKKQKKIETVIICLFLLITISFMILEYYFLNPLKNDENLRELNSPKLSSTPLWNYITNINALSITISANGRYIAAGTQNNKVYFFENSSSQPLWVYHANNWISSLAISSDGNYIIAGGDREGGRNVYFFNVTNAMDPLLWSYGAIGDILGVAISSNGSYITVVDEYWDIYFFNKSSSIPMQVWSLSGDVDTVRFSSNGKYIVAGGRDHNVYLYHWSNSTPLWNYATEGRIHSAAISSDGRYIVAGGEYVVSGQTTGILYFFNKSSSTPLWNYTIGSSVSTVVFSSDGDYFAVGSRGENWRREIHLFRSLYSTPLAKYSTSGSYGISIAISSDGSYIAAAMEYSFYLFHKSGFDDDYEENDIFFEAPLLTEGNYTGLTLNGFDQDYFGINFSSNIEIEIEILFDHSLGNLNLYLYDPSQIEINSSSSNTDDEYMSYISNSSGIFTILVDSASDNSIQPYELRIRLSLIRNIDENRDILLPISFSIISIIIAIGIVGSLGLIYGNYKYHWLWNRKLKRQIKPKEKIPESSKTILNPMIRKALYFIPIIVFFVVWWVDVGISIAYLIKIGDFYILSSWVFDWPQLTDDFLIYTNTFSAFFFGCYAWSITTFILGNKNPERFIRVIKSICLFYPFWFGMSIYLGIIGVGSYSNGWLSVHIIFGLWVASGAIISIYMIVTSSDNNLYWDQKYIIPRTKSLKIRDFFDRYQAFFFISIIFIIGTFFSIFLGKAFISIFWTSLTILLILLLNFLFSMKINYHARVKQEEEELLLNEFQVLLRKSKGLAERGNKNFSKKSYQPAIENWKKALDYYKEALKKAVEKEKIKENLRILKESIFNAYKGRANVHNKNALKAYEKPDLQIAQKEWRLANSNFQAAINLIKVDKLNFSSDKLQKATKNIEIKLKQLEIEMDILDADNELKKARSFQKKDLKKAIKMVNGIIIKFSEAKEKTNKNALFKPLSETLETRIINCREFQHKLQEKMDEMIGITPISKRIIVDEINIIDSEIPSVRKDDVKKPILSIIREFEFIGGQLRFKVGLKNNTQYSLTSLKITFDIPKALKWILHEPGYERKGDSLLISKLGVNEKKAISLYLEPINCMESSINATISFYDVRDKPHALTMKPKMISITCPIFFTKVDANLARVKSLRRRLAHHDKKIFPLIRSEESLLIFSSILSVLEKFDIKLTYKDFSEEDRFGEAWFYGITKVKKNQFAIYVLLDGENRKIEIEVSGNDNHK